MNILFGRHSNRSRALATLAGTAVTLLSLGMATLHAQPAGAAEVAQPVSAVWKPYELDFHYFGSTTYYNCSALEDRLEQLLQEMGADKEMRVTVTGCFGPADIGKMLTAHIRVRMPVSGEPQAQSFLVSSKPVTLKAGRSGQSGASDCELLEQVRDQILPVFKLQLVKDDLGCVPGQATYSNRSLQVMALLPEPAKK